MKLVKPAERHIESVTLSHRASRTYTQWIRGNEEEPRAINQTSAGRFRFSDCVIDFENEQFILGEKIPLLEFGEEVYLGVLPLVHDHGSTVVACWVDYVEKKNK